MNPRYIVERYDERDGKWKKLSSFFSDKEAQKEAKMYAEDMGFRTRVRAHYT